ncbi:hypothetical protein H4J38_09295 [Colwellia sp. BRX10-3]|uniref:hypothetical protein n=1 Tax=Colwellia sp. BRX10-3 TaxID=2759844 RepID=UPI0015F77BB2|nr:hypothetical protein [Colwellia sp. BRX10-3]MBA6390967.1 hypothetical protein [Colwellia sp. BRX10-3]
MDDKIVNFPNKYERKKRVDLRNGELRCEVSERWVKFPKASDKYPNCEYLHLDIMTLGANEKDRKLCEIILDKEQLLKLLSELPVTDHTKT